MFNAYYDTRRGEVIRILAFIDKVLPTVKTYCKFWYKDDVRPVFSPVYEYKTIWHEEWEYNSVGSQPHLVACVNPRLGAVPDSVTLVENKTDVVRNNLKIIYNLPKGPKKRFGVCVKDLDFMDDQTIQVIEWVEILSLLGADMFYIYVIKVHPNVMKTLKYYEKLGRVKVEMMTEPKNLPTKEQSIAQWLQNELISLNDCLYKHLYEFEFLVPLDIDEIIMPVREEDKTWRDLLDREIEKRRQDKTVLYSTYTVCNVFFLSDNNHQGEIQPEVPANFLFLQSIYRAQNFSVDGVGEKSFQNTEKVLAMHNHNAMFCFDTNICDWYLFEKSYAQLNHYRKGCENYPVDECEGFKKNTVKDVMLWRCKKDVIKNVKETLDGLSRFKINLRNL